jgi:hypothetical protein
MKEKSDENDKILTDCRRIRPEEHSTLAVNGSAASVFALQELLGLNSEEIILEATS